MTINNFKRLPKHKQKKVEQNDYIEVVDNQELLGGDDEGEDFDDFSSECTEIDRPFRDTISEDSDFYEISVKPSNEWTLPQAITLKGDSEKFTEALSNIYGMLSKGRTTHTIKGMVFKVKEIGKIDGNPFKIAIKTSSATTMMGLPAHINLKFYKRGKNLVQTVQITKAKNGKEPDVRRFFVILQWLIAGDIDKVYDLLKSNQKENLRCDLCDKKFIQKRGLILHLYEEHPERFSELKKKSGLEEGTENIDTKAEVSKNETVEVETLPNTPDVPKKHFCATLDQNQTTCNECEVLFNSSANHVKHTKSSHEKNKKNGVQERGDSQTCQKCSCSLIDCQCSLQTLPKVALNYLNAIKEHDESGNPRIFKCTECGSNFQDVSSLETHLTSHINPTKNTLGSGQQTGLKRGHSVSESENVKKN